MLTNGFVLHGIAVIACINLGTAYLSAQNLVPNPSFEDTVACPAGPSQMYATGWVQPTLGTCDYFNSCSNGPADVPQNFDGWQNAKTGTAYAGVFVFIKGNANAREYIQAKLTDTLVAGLRYRVSFYVSLADSNGYACNSFGAYLSSTAINNSINAAPFPYIPQIVNPLSNSLASKTSWVQICDTIIATGNELYITIGNFDDDANSDTTYVGGSSFDKYSYYYIDDVSVYTNDSLNTLDMNENDLLNKIFISPNPSSGIINVHGLSSDVQISSVEVLNLFGQKIFYSNEGFEFSKIDMGHSVNGIYFLQLKTDREMVTRKIIIQK